MKMLMFNVYWLLFMFCCLIVIVVFPASIVQQLMLGRSLFHTTRRLLLTWKNMSRSFTKKLKVFITLFSRFVDVWRRTLRLPSYVRICDANWRVIHSDYNTFIASNVYLSFISQYYESLPVLLKFFFFNFICILHFPVFKWFVRHAVWYTKCARKNGLLFLKSWSILVIAITMKMD